MDNMSLYKILFVDDEEEVRKSIIKKIPWDTVGFEVVGDAENGEDALDKISSLEPDVVITDIKMPFMDGLELAKRVKQERSSIEVVIFSGFNEFEYAKQAIKINVTEYILKPVNVKELTEILKNLKKKLDDKIAAKRNVDQLREKYQSTLPIIRTHFLKDLVDKEMKQDKILEKLEEYNIDIGNARKWIVASVFIEIPANSQKEEIISLHREKELIPISVEQILKEHLMETYRFVSFRNATGICVIGALEEDQSYTGFVHRLNQVCKDCKKILDITITIGVGEECFSLTALNESYREAKEAIGYRAIIGDGSAIYIKDVEPIQKEYLKFSEQDEGELIYSLKFGNSTEIAQVVDTIILKLKKANVHVSQQQIYIISIMNSLMRMIQKYELNVGSDQDYFGMLSKLFTLEDVQQLLMKLCLAIHKNLNRDRNDTTKNTIQEAKNFIFEHFDDSELSVEMVCSHLHLSEAYFSTLFKKEVGQSYINYLTELRLNKAMELLNKTEDKIYIIAQSVGYLEANYFSYVFKKKFGTSPSKYRSRR